MNRTELQKPNPALRFRAFFLVCGVVMLLSEIWKQFTLTFAVNGGAYIWLYFPFQLCSTPMYVLLVLPHVRRESLKNALLTYLMTFGLLGGVIVLADTSGLHYALPALTFHSFAWHAALAAVGVLAGIARGKPSPRDLKNALLLYAACCVLAAVLNASLGQFGEINLFYINPACEMEQVVFRDLVPVLGKGAVLVLYMCMTALGAALLWAVWRGIAALSAKKHGPAA